MKRGRPITLVRMAQSVPQVGWAFSLVAILVGTGCTKPRPPGAPAPSTGAQPETPPSTPSLPTVPLVQGPLAPRVTFPPPDYAISSRDSNFIFGTIGNGRASLTINGHP